MKKWVRTRNVSLLPDGYPIDRDFKPRYNPWDERPCLVADGDVFAEIAKGNLEMVTDHIDHFDETGIVLKSGRHLAADIIVTATGLQLQALGGVPITVDGEEVKCNERFSYRAHMIDGVPNLFWCIGYFNASWTLRADITARSAARLIEHMKAHGFTHAYPHLDEQPTAEEPTWDLQAGYLKRGLSALPRSGTKRPWAMPRDFVIDSIENRFRYQIDKDMVFGHQRVRGPLVGS